LHHNDWLSGWCERRPRQADNPTCDRPAKQEVQYQNEPTILLLSEKGNQRRGKVNRRERAGNKPRIGDGWKKVCAGRRKRKIGKHNRVLQVRTVTISLLTTYLGGSNRERRDFVRQGWISAVITDKNVGYFYSVHDSGW
jgi:hypothetical protein